MKPSREVSNLGSALMLMGVCTEDQIGHALQVQQSDPDQPLLGDVLKRLGYATEQDIEEALACQERMRKSQDEALRVARELESKSRARTEEIDLAAALRRLEEP